MSLSLFGRPGMVVGRPPRMALVVHLAGAFLAPLEVTDARRSGPAKVHSLSAGNPPAEVARAAPAASNGQGAKRAQTLIIASRAPRRLRCGSEPRRRCAD